MSLLANASARRGATDVFLELQSVEALLGGVGFFEIDFDRDRARFSPGLCAILGLSEGTEMSFSEASRLFDERDRAAVKASVEAAAFSPEQGKWGGVHRVLRADGAVRWVAVQGQRTYRETPYGPQPLRSIGLVMDITDTGDHNGVRESERRLRLALSAGRMGTFEVDIAATQALIDAQEARLLGLPAGTRMVSVEELRKRVPFEDLAISDVKQKRLTQGGEPYHHEFRLRLPDGSERWLSAYADVRSNRIFGVNFDVTQRKRAEAALANSEARVRIATSGAALGIFEWDPNTDHAVWENDRIYEIFGRGRADGPVSKRQFVTDYLHPDDADAFEVALERAMRTEGAFHAVCRITLKRGGLRWLQIDGKFEVTASDKPPRLVGVIADVTSRKRLEARAERLSDRLLTIQEEERRRIAQELHDSTVQHLVASTLMLTSLRSKSASESIDHKDWDGLEASLEEAMKELRTFSYLMHPPALRGPRLRHSLQQYIDGFADRSGIACKLRVDSQLDKLSSALRRPLFRIVQESLANVYRHASASRASVSIRRNGSLLHLIITDNGLGMHTRQGAHRPTRPGVGLRGIRVRLKKCGGQLRISQPAAGGTRIHAVLPAAAHPR
jgi:signal transduction histidine kinase